MTQAKHKHESRMNQLLEAAKQMNIEVRTEKLLREVGYRARSGWCRVKGQDLILIDRDAPTSDQIEFLSAALAEHQKSAVPHPNPQSAAEV
jgi:hypothetical protein